MKQLTLLQYLLYYSVTFSGLFSHKSQEYCSALFRRFTFHTTQQSTQDRSTQDQSTQDHSIQDQSTQHLGTSDLGTPEVRISDLGTSEQKTPNADLALSFYAVSVHASGLCSKSTASSIMHTSKHALCGYGSTT